MYHSIKYFRPIKSELKLQSGCTARLVLLNEIIIVNVQLKADFVTLRPALPSFTLVSEWRNLSNVRRCFGGFTVLELGNKPS